ncbi:MAG: DUF2103 domain-containing protein [Cyanophyceae cyanobacterium]
MFAGAVVGKKGRRSLKSEAEGDAQKPPLLTGRLVWNHSTHVPGLIKILERLIKLDGVGAITPAVISHGRSNSPQLRLKVSVPIRGGFKLIARKGKTTQEVFVITHLTKPGLETAIQNVI